MGGQLPGVGGVVAGDVGDDGQLALALGHDVLQDQLTLGHGLVDALAGGAADVDALDTLLDEPTGQLADGLGIDAALGIVAGIEGRNNALILFQVFHNFSLCDEIVDWRV